MTDRSFSPRLRKGLLWGGAAAAVLLGAFFMLRPKAAEQEEAIRREYPVSVGTITVGIDAAGTITSQKTGQFAPAAAKLKDFCVRVGDRVAQGDALAEYDLKDLLRLIGEKKQTLDAKQAELDQLTYQQSSAAAKLEQQIAQLRSTGSQAPDTELASLEEQKQAARRQADAAQSQADAAKAKLEQAKADQDARPQTLAALEAQLAQLDADLAGLRQALEDQLKDPAADPGEIAVLRAQIAQKEVVQSDAVRQKDALLAADYPTLIAQYEAEINAALAQKAQAEATLPGIEEAIGQRAEARERQKQAEDAQVLALQQQAKADGAALSVKLQAAQTARDTAQQEYSDALALKADPFVRASCDGVVASLDAKPGTLADPAAALAQLGDDTKRTLRLQVDPMDITDVQFGQQVSFYVDAYPQATFSGTVAAISQLQNENGKFDVQVSFVPGEDPLLDGMGANATLIVKEKQDVLCLSNKAIQFENGQSFVYLADENGQLARRDITTGFSNGRSTEVLSGLQSGDVALLEERYEDR